MILFQLLCYLIFSHFIHTSYLVGIGIHDVTGPSGGVNFMGYANIKQITQGIHTRLRARSFLFLDPETDKRVIYVSIDLPMMTQQIKKRVIESLGEMYPGLYTEKNVLMSSTHTHSGPGGYHEYLLYSLTSLGFVKQSEDMIVEGIVGSIKRAHSKIIPSDLYLTNGTLFDVNINRSPYAYTFNPESERKKYQYDTDKEMLMLKIQTQEGKLRGSINWFAVHCTSMNNTNRLVSGDNKGYAAYLLEKEWNTADSSDYKPYMLQQESLNRGDYIVHAFSQGPEGDVSPNVLGAFCLNTGLPCSFPYSTCKDEKQNDRNELCHARGLGYQKGDQESTKQSGWRQFLKARQLLNQEGSLVTGGISFAHAWIKMSHLAVKVGNDMKWTCKPSRGFSFAAGTTDGPGQFDFYQGMNNSNGNPFWNHVRNFLSKPTREQASCHYPKPILLNTGEINLPYPWEPPKVSIQLLKVGQVIIVGVPGEFSTMAGRRLKGAISGVYAKYGSQVRVVIAGLSNMYSGYVTTREEYQVQRYEGASTIYGPHTLEGYIQEFKRLALGMLFNDTSDESIKQDIQKDLSELPEVPFESEPEDFSQRLLGLVPPVLFDAVPPAAQFGAVIKGEDALPHYQPGDVVKVGFWGGHPRNTGLETTFLRVEKYIGPTVEQLKPLFNEYSQVKVLNDVRTGYLILNATKAVTFQQSESDTAEIQLYYSREYGLTDEPPSLTENNMWLTVRDDDDWDTKYKWSHTIPVISPFSKVYLEWEITDIPYSFTGSSDLIGTSSTVNGLYRLKYEGAHKLINGNIVEHSGVSRAFTVGESLALSHAEYEDAQVLFSF